MTDLAGAIPPFAALRAFHAAARHGRFRDAASDLGVSESAISHQVRRLEEHLHVQLFDRNGPRVRLTAAGARYFADIDPAILQIAEATRALTGPRERRQVTMTLPPSLAMLWLIPNLALFESACPDIDLQLVTTTRLVDLRREQVDLAIRHGLGKWPDVEATFLFSERAMPVCKPDYVQANEIEDPAGLLGARRLIVNGYFPDEWSEWSKARGISPVSTANALRLDSQEQVLAAAEQGLGLAIGRSPLVDSRLESGALVAPFGRMSFARAAYFLCLSMTATPSASVRRVARWLGTFGSQDRADAGAAAVA